MAVHDWRQPGFDPQSAQHPPATPSPGAIPPAAQPTGQPSPVSPWPGQPAQPQPPQTQAPQGQYPPAQPAQPASYPQAQPTQAYPQGQPPAQPGQAPLAQAYPMAGQPAQPQGYPQQAYPAQGYPQPAQQAWSPGAPSAAPYVPQAGAPVAQPVSPAPTGFPGIDVTAGQPEQSRKQTQAAQQSAEEEPDDETEEDDKPWNLPSLSSAPPWLVSMVTHVTLLLILGLMIIPFTPKDKIELEAVYASDIGEQLDDAMLQATADPMDIPNPMLSLSDLPEVPDPLAAPPDTTMDDFVGETMLSEVSAPTVGLALSGRQTGMKRALLARYGGNRQTELAVEEALKWLQRNQESDGSWSMMGPYADGANNENRLSATAMALLAFQGAGHTHLEGEYKKEVALGWKYLLPQMDANGDFWTTGVTHHRLYSQAQATIALCELYGMTEDPELQQPAQTAINFAVRSQSPEGGWRYSPGNDSDTSVTGWFVMALQSGMMAGLEVPPATLVRVESYLNAAGTDNGTRYAYTSAGQSTLPMTAEGLLCRQYLGWEHDDERLANGVQYLSANPINFGDQNVYYWYYATQVVHHMEGEAWTKWNKVLREELPNRQVMEGAERGSWDPNQDRWGVQIGRLYQTCLSVYMLEVYYRHLPVYSNLYEVE